MEPISNEDTFRTQGPHLRPATMSGFMPLRLNVQPGDAEVELTQAEVIVGRHTSVDVRLPYPEISRRHCRFLFEAGQWRVIDLDSMNGVYVNGERMYDAVVYDGDQVRVGLCELTVRRGTMPPFAAPPRKSDPELAMLKRIADVLPPR